MLIVVDKKTEDISQNPSTVSIYNSSRVALDSSALWQYLNEYLGQEAMFQAHWF